MLPAATSKWTITMTRITVSAELASQIAGATDGLTICDPTGKVLLSVPPTTSHEERLRSAWTAEEIAEAKRSLASDQPRYTTSEVLEHLRNLENP